MQIQPNTHVTLECQLKDASGERLDEGDEPIEYVHGYSTLVPGLENALIGLKVGDVKDVVVAPKDGFGEHDEELVLEVDRSEFPKDIAVGDEFLAESDDGEEVTMRVLEVRKDSVIVDANHPFAGQTLHYHVRVAALRDASDAEIAEAAAAYDEAMENKEGHVHNENCGHGASDSAQTCRASSQASELIQLTSKSAKKQIVLN